MEINNFIMGILIGIMPLLVFIIGVWFLIYMDGKPLFKMHCEYCNTKDRNWTIVSIRLHNIIWSHNCKEDK